MKSLDQIEARTPISSTPFTIGSPGSYYLTQSLSVSTGNAITINTSGVTLDLNGFTISSSANPASGSGILINGGFRDITITNGHIRGGVANNGGTYSGSGFLHGISGSLSVNARVTGVSVFGCLSGGIVLGTNATTVVESCTVLTVGDIGIQASTVKKSVAIDTGNSAIIGDQVSDCRGKTNSLGGTRAGISATTVENSYGFSNGTGFGISTEVGLNCYGFSDSGIGINATAASNCEGASNSGKGIAATNAQDCSASSGSGTALYVYGMAMNCYASGGNIGINVTENTLMNCFVTGSITGISVGNNCLIEGNNLIGNTTGIHVTGTANRIDGNRVNCPAGGQGFVFDGANNVISRNSAVDNGTNQYQLNAANSLSSVVNVRTSAFPATDAWANLVY